MYWPKDSNLCNGTLCLLVNSYGRFEGFANVILGSSSPRRLVEVEDSKII